MKPVWMPIVFASERPLALKIFISDTLPAPDPSAVVPEIRQRRIREGSVHVHEEELDFSCTGENFGRSEIGERDFSMS